MSDLQILYLVLLALYGWECVCWLPRGTFVVRTWMGVRWRLVKPSPLVSNAKGGFVLANPLPPLGTLFFTTHLPLSVSPMGISNKPASGDRAWAGGNAWIEFSQLEDLRADHKRIRGGKGTLFSTPSKSWALRLARLLEEWRAQPASNRMNAVRAFLRASLDLKDIRNRWEIFQKATRRLRWLVNALFTYLFVITPLVIWLVGLGLTWPFLLAGVLAFTFTISFEFRKRHREFYPHSADERFTLWLTLLLSPANAIRAVDVLSRPFFEANHPLALARHFCSPQDFRRVAAETWRSISYQVPGCASGAARDAEVQTSDVLRSELQRFLEQNGISTGELLAPPDKGDPSCLSYCPRCLAQFVTVKTHCQDCGGLESKPL
jgi:hypothetical protein